jgi:hypothetical protein
MLPLGIPGNVHLALTGKGDDGRFVTRSCDVGATPPKLEKDPMLSAGLFRTNSNDETGAEPVTKIWYA